MIDRKKLKLAAREAMREARPHPAWVTLAAALILAVLALLSATISGSLNAYRQVVENIINGAGIYDGLTAVTSSDEGSAFGQLLVLALWLLSIIISTGYTLYCLRISRRIQASFGDLFDAFGIFLRAVLLHILKGAVLFLWELVFIAAFSLVETFALILFFPDVTEEALQAFINSPWILLVVAVMNIPLLFATYFYRLAAYFMLDDPNIPCLRCLSMSRMAMKGRKWQLFKLDLSFLGWYVLSIIPFVGLWVAPYVAVTQANFFTETVPQFMQDLERRFKENAEAAQHPPAHGYSVPGQTRDDEEDENDPE